MAEELASLGASQVDTRNRLVVCRGDRELLYRATLACRTAIRVLTPIHRFAARNEKALYAGIQQVDWCELLQGGRRFAVDPLVRNSFCTHSLYAAQLTKDSVVDQMRAKTGARPSVDLQHPDVLVSLYLNNDEATVYLDASGESLHKRGYRKQTGRAPMSEVLAAGIVLLSQWDRQSPLQDPMCGSGTLLIEAALLAKNVAPGLLGRKYGFENWVDYDRDLHQRLLEEARRQVVHEPKPVIQGSDQDRAAVAAAKENAKAAGVDDWIRFEVARLEDADVPEGPGVVLLNPPYDERLSLQDSAAFYQRMGDVLKHRYAGKTAFVFSGALDAAKQIGLRASQKTKLYNGPIECRLLRFELFKSEGKAPSWRDADTGSTAVPPQWRSQFEMFENRLRKMAKHWGKWARRQEVSCYRVYDRDIPDVPLTIDRYADHVYCAEYDRPHDRTAKEHRVWLDLVLRKVAEILEVPTDRLHLRKRERQRGNRQYRRGQTTDERFLVTEGGRRFWVNLSDYLDTGLFLDHRITRSMVERQSQGKRFLNLFGYTGSFTVYAAAGGAASTTTVDTSNTYLQWAKANLRENGFSGNRHQFVRSDALEFLRDRQGVPLFDLVVVDPPTFSNSKSDQRLFDVQKDHVQLLELTLSVVPSGGAVYFSTNRRKFRFELDRDDVQIREITSQTVPPDFQRKRPHRCWLLRKE